MNTASGDTGLLEGLIQQNLLNEELLGHLGDHADRLPDLEQLRQLLRMELTLCCRCLPRATACPCWTTLRFRAHPFRRRAAVGRFTHKPGLRCWKKARCGLEC